jgi:RNA polymerase sigma-70 factor (ECF subfamily)
MPDVPSEERACTDAGDAGDAGDRRDGTPVQHLVAHLFRRSSGAIVASLTRRFGLVHLPLVEDAVQDALLEATRRWPFEGIPREPAAWLHTVARRKALDVLRRSAVLDRKVEAGGRGDAAAVAAGAEIARAHDAGTGAGTGDEAMWLDEPFALDDDVLGMLFACCTPSLGRETAIALTLTVVAGFTAHEAAQAFLVSEAAMAQRLVRAKRRLRESGAPISIPAASELPSRLSQVLDVVYLMFNEGYMASDGDVLMREQMCGEAARLAVLLSEHAATAAPIADALAALLLFQLARLPARAGTDGGPVLLEAQDRTTWNPALIGAGFHHLSRAARGNLVTPLHLQAEIASRHVMAERYELTDWPAILRAYDALLEMEPTVVVRVNRAVAVGKVHGHAAALVALSEAARDPSGASYRWFYSVRAHFRSECGDVNGALDDLRRAAALTRSSPTRRWLEERHAALLDS